jgi:hypothetical protein
MNGPELINELPVFLRALEGLPILVFAAAYLVISVCIRKNPLFS